MSTLENIYQTNLDESNLQKSRVKGAMLRSEAFRVLILEDEPEIRSFLMQQFSEVGCQVESLPSGEGFLDKLEKFQPQMIVMDQLMPGKSGMQLIRELRSSVLFSNVPVMMLTGLDSEADKVAALELGADDYVVKPFSVREVVARAQALFRRSQAVYRGQQRSLTLNDVTVDLIAHQVKRAGVEVSLTLTEFKIFVELIRHVGEVVSRDELRSQALGNLRITDRTIDVHMAALRKKLGDFGTQIETVRGVGYRLS